MARIPEKIGKYKVVSQIAKGGMGAVYKGEHPTLDRYVILKKLTLRGSASIRERFKREARLMMDFKNDYIVDVYDHFSESGSHYIVLEYVDGMSLDDLLKQERYLPNDMALLIFRDACRALKYAHDRGVVHRDIKPANILISKTGDVKLVDFGIASSKEDSEAGLTREGMTLGTPSYMAPEQFQSTKTVDRRADIYSMGVMLYEMVTGKKPYPGDLSAESLALIQKGKHTPAKRINPKISPMVNRIIRRSMKPAANKRFPDLDPLLASLDKHLRVDSQEEVRTQIREFIWGDREDMSRTRRKRSAAGVALTVVALAAILGGLGYLSYEFGYYHELFRAKEYGALRVAARVPKISKDVDDIFIEATLFRDDGEEIPEVDGVDFRFQENPLAETGDFFTLESSKVYVPNGSYRLKVQVENQLYWQPFFLEPRAIQRTRPATIDARTITTDVASPAGLPVAVIVDVTDRFTGEPLGAGTIIRYQRDGDWVRWNSFVAASVRSGSVHRFRVERRGYYSQEFSLLVAPYQSNLSIKAELTPLPATVTVTSVGESVRLSLDGADMYIAGGPGGEYQPIPEIIPGDPVTLSIVPDTYVVSATVGRAEALPAELTLEPGGEGEILVTYNQETRTIDISVR
jgi:serine/threonine-protein kinase